MFGPRKALVLATLFLSAFATPTHSHDDDLSNWEKFSALLDSVDEGALHRVLHAIYPKFKDGVFSKDRTAVEHVHSENPVMASKLVHIAKRQSSNSTVIATTSSAEQSSTRRSTSTAQTSVAASPSTPQETSQSLASMSVQSSVSSVLTSALSSQIFATTVPPATTVLVAPSSPQSATPISTANGAIVYSTQGGGVVTLTSSAVRVSFTPSTSTHLYYTTSADGTVGTRTSLIIVNAPVTETAAATGAAGAATTTGSAGLQNGAVKATTGGFTAFLIGMLGFVAAF